MKDFEFKLHGVITRHSTEVKNNVAFNRMVIKCSETDEVNDLMEKLRSWGELADNISNLVVIRNVDDDPYDKRVIKLDEYNLCLNLSINDDVVPVRFKSMTVSIKTRTVKDLDGNKIKKKYLEAILQFEKKRLETDLRFDDLYLKHTTPDSVTGKDVITPLEINFKRIEAFSLIDNPTENADDNDDDVLPSVYQAF